MEEQLLETWRIHNRIHIYIIDAIDAGSLGDSLGGKGRTGGWPGQSAACPGRVGHLNRGTLRFAPATRGSILKSTAGPGRERLGPVAGIDRRPEVARRPGWSHPTVTGGR